MNLTTLLAQLISILIVKLQKVVIRGKICFLILEHFFSKCTFLRFFYFCFFAQRLSNQLNFLVVVHIYQIRVFDDSLSLLTITMAMIHIYALHLNGVVLRRHVTNKIHISTSRRCIDTTLGKVLTQCRRLPNKSKGPRSFDRVTNMRPHD